MICRLCGKKESRPLLIFKNYPLSLWPCSLRQSFNSLDLKVYKCKNCGLSQIQRFKNNLIKKFYQNDSKVLNNKKVLLNRVKKIKESVKNSKNLNILEVGGGRNNIINYFRNTKGWLSDFNFDKPYKKYNLLKGNFNNIKAKKNFFDFVFCFHTLEHIENPKKFLKKIHNSLTFDGKIIIEVPNSKIYLSKCPYYAFFFQHQSIFTKNTLVNLLNGSGFKLERSLNKTSEPDILLMVFSKSMVYKKFFIAKNDIILKIKKKIIKKINLAKTKIKKLKAKKIAIYGCGGTSLTLYYHLKKNNINIEYFYDMDKRKIKLFMPLTNIQVSHPRKILADNPDLIITSDKQIFYLVSKKFKKMNFLCLA